jgi:hypothetical protein
MLGVTNVYFIWYGIWNGSSTPPILADLVQNLGGSSYFQAVTRYANAAGIAPMNAVQYSGAYFDWFSRGTSLSSTDVMLVAADAIASGNLPSDPDGVYVVLTSANVAETSGFGTAYCGWHNQIFVNGVTAKTIFVGNPARAPAQCMPQQVSPNGDSAADAMASVFVNELFDTITDPVFTAWYDRFALEAADKCAWDFGKTYRTSNGARANIQLGARDYLLQRLWNPSGKGSCTLDVNAAS